MCPLPSMRSSRTTYPTASEYWAVYPLRQSPRKSPVTPMARKVPAGTLTRSSPAARKSNGVVVFCWLDPSGVHQYVACTEPPQVEVRPTGHRHEPLGGL